MADKHDKSNADYRKHITAAKAWIGQAEESIDKDNEIRSDLNLMLAQAELQRAKERDDVRLWKKWLKWTIPWVAALSIAAFYFLVLRTVPPNTAVPNTVTSSEAAEGSSSPQVIAKEEHRPAEQELYHEDNSDNEPIANIEQQADGLGTEHKIIDDRVILKDNLQHEQVDMKKSMSSGYDGMENKGSIPTEDIQRLMQSAGRALRE